jgi:hypothetical protein
MVQNREVQFIVEDTREGFVHPCTVNDLCRILGAVPAIDWEELQTFLLRQPSQKQLLIDPTWGRLAHSADIGQPGQPHLHRGPAIVLEAVTSSVSFKWDKSLSPSATRELERLKSDGHHVEDSGRYFIVSGDTTAARATQLYRTVLHEIGHWVDWLDRVERPSRMSGKSFADLTDAYWARPNQDREAFAHKYADRMRSRLTLDGGIPFDRIEIA